MRTAAASESSTSRGPASSFPARAGSGLLVSEAICRTGAGRGIGGEVCANKLAKAEDAANRELKSDRKTLSTPIGGGALLSGVTPLMADGWG